MQNALITLLNIQLVGFCYWSIAYAIASKHKFVRDADIVVTMLARIGVLIYIIYFIASTISAYFGSDYESYAFINRSTGPYWWAFWIMLLNPLISTQLMWIKKIRTNKYFRLVIGLVLLVGISMERIVILITSYHRDYLPNSWSMKYPFAWSDLYSIGIFIALNGLVFTAHRMSMNLNSKSI